MKELESIKKIQMCNFEKNKIQNSKEIFGGKGEDPDTGAECPTDYTSYYGQPDCASDECTDVVITDEVADTPTE